MDDPKRLFDLVFEAMHYAGRRKVEDFTDEQLLALLDFNEGNAWIQDVIEEELARREEV